MKQCSARSILYESVPEAFDLSCSRQSERCRFWVVGSCNGLVCMLIDKKEMILWNPSTGICKKLPDFGVEINVGGYFTYGFGYDKSSDDYKVVGFFNNNRDSSEVMMQVYSLRNDVWKRIENFKGRWSMDDTATFANGKLYWITNQGYELESSWDILSFDLETEEYEILQMPSYVKSGYYSRLGGAWEGSLHVLCSHQESADVWIMDVGGGHWTKVATVPYIDDFLKYTFKSALHILMDGRVLFCCGSTLVIFDVKDYSFRYPEVNLLESGELAGVGAYLESLVSPVG